MIDCPRCGFSQPKDRYCANCGLDIDSFQPIPKPITERVWKDSRLQVFLFFVLLISTISILYVKNKELIQSQILGISEAPPKPVEKVKKAIQEPKPIKVISHSKVAKKETPSKALLEKEAPAQVPATKIKIQFYEISNDEVSEIFDLGEIQGNELSGVQIKGFATQISSKIAQGGMISLSPGATTDDYQVNAPVFLNHGFISGENEESGMSVEITPNLIESEGSEFQIKAQLHIPLNAPEPPITLEFTEEFQINSGNSLIIKDLFGQIDISTNQISEATLQKISQSPLSILKSDDFNTQVTTLIMVIDTLP